MSDNPETTESRLERAKRLIEAGTSPDDAATQCGVDRSMLEAYLSNRTESPAGDAQKKRWTPLEVTFWLPD
jgi:hypothetical protein